MVRNVLKTLDKWRISPRRRPLILRGARQVGKTWLARQLGKSFKTFIEINFENQPEFHKIFRENFGKPEELLKAISNYTEQKVVPGESLLLFDEIQECKEALVSLRYFYENLPKQHVIATGSLLEFALKELSFPVGRVEFLHVFPLSFQEFILARNKLGWIEAIQKKDPIQTSLEDLLLNELRTYSLIGGMPEVIRTYIETEDLRECQEVQQILVANYMADFSKYASRAKVEHLKIIFENLPRFLGQKFKYSNVSEHYRARELSEALQLMKDAGLVYCVYHSSANGVPLGAQMNPKKFKVFFLDIGLCHRILGLQLKHLFVSEPKNILVNRGGLAEQFVAQEIVSTTLKNSAPQLYYWHREEKSANAEIDFVIEKNGKVFPIEVKSGNSGSQKSLNVFLKEKGLLQGLRVCPQKSGLSSFSMPLEVGKTAEIEQLGFYELYKIGEE